MTTRVAGWSVTPVVRSSVVLPRNAIRPTSAGTVWKGRARRGCNVKGWPVTPCDEPRRARSVVVAAASTVASDSGAVLLFGATGSIGRGVLRQLLETGRPVIAAVRSAAKLAEMGLGGEGLRVVDGVDVMKPETLTAALFSGVQQVVLCVGPAQGDGSKDSRNNDPYDPAAVPAYFVDSVGVMNVVSAAERFLTPMAEMAILNSADVTPDTKWTGVSFGASASCITPDANGIRMEGTLEQGERVRDLTPTGTIQWGADCELDLAAADGLTFSVKGDGHSHFITLQNDESGSQPQSFFAASFDTVDGQWTSVKIPLHQFRLVRQGIPDQTAVLVPSSTVRLGWMSTTKTVDGFPNRKSPAGAFSFSVASVSTYKAARPQLVHVSSAGPERSARIGERMDLRNEELPIVRMNPGGILNHKFEGNNIVRCSTLPYTIVCPNAFISKEFETEDLKPDLLEFSQGDTTAGRLRYVELAEVIVQCLERPEAVSKTFQVRRSPGVEAKNKSMTDAHYLRQFLTLSNDEDRPKVGLPPYPEPVSVDAPVWRGGRRNERPDDALMKSILQGAAAARARRAEELLPQKE